MVIYLTSDLKLVNYFSRYTEIRREEQCYFMFSDINFNLETTSWENGRDKKKFINYTLVDKLIPDHETFIRFQISKLL